MPEIRRRVHLAAVYDVIAPKAVCDFGIDLRTHDPRRSRSQGYCDR